MVLAKEYVEPQLLSTVRFPHSQVRFLKSYHCWTMNIKVHQNVCQSEKQQKRPRECASRSLESLDFIELYDLVEPASIRIQRGFKSGFKFPYKTRKRNKIRGFQSSGRIVGKSKTSLMLGLSVRSITRRSIPYPIPPVGGIPISSAVRKSSSVWLASSSPAANAAS